MNAEWKSVCSGEQADRAIAVASSVADRLRRLSGNHAIISTRGTQWRVNPFDLAVMAVLYQFLYYTRGDWEHEFFAEKFFSAAIFHTVSCRSGALSKGLSQLGLLALMLHDGPNRHKRFLESTDLQISSECFLRSKKIRDLSAVTNIDQSDYDVVSGLSGMMRYLIARRSAGSIENVLVHSVDTLIKLVRFPGPFLPQKLTNFLSDRVADESGLINCGLAHGMPGVLASLSIARIEGVDADGLCETIDMLACWLQSLAVKSEDSIRWPYKVPRNQDFREMSHDGWCYGGPGVLRSIWLAGKALSCADHKSFAIMGIEKLLSNPRILDSENGATLCHGLAGRLLIALRFCNETSVPSMYSISLIDRLLEEFRSEYKFGFREPDLGDNLVDDPSFVTGASGVALALLAATTNREPMWDRLMMVS